MKGFILDENLPRRIRFQPSWPVIHAHALGAGVSDADIWAHAHANELAIVTKDADFSTRMLPATPPPWVVHLRFGNLGRHAYHQRMAECWPHVENLLPRAKLIEVHARTILHVSA